MDDQAFHDTVKRLQEVNGIVAKLDPAIRGEAFSLLKPYVDKGTTGATGAKSSMDDTVDAAGLALDFGGAEEFFTTHEGGKPADNAYLVVAYLYSQYGATPFSMEDVRAVADHAGLTLPERVDVTLSGAKKAGKALFKRAGRGRLQPNVHGETYLKNTYEVTRGNKRRA